MVTDTTRTDSDSGEGGQIYALLPLVMADIAYIEKKGRNEHDKYNFRSIDQVYDTLHEPLAKHGVFFVPEVLDRHSEVKTSTKGTEMTHTTLTVRYTFYAPDGSSVSATAVGESIDRGDKSCNKAMSAALKYLALQVFCIPVNDQQDADDDSPEPAARGNFNGQQAKGGKQPQNPALRDAPQGGNGHGQQKREGYYHAVITGVEEDRREWGTIYKVHTQTGSGKAGTISTTDDEVGKQAREHAETGAEVVLYWYLNKKDYVTLKAVQAPDPAPAPQGEGQQFDWSAPTKGVDD